MEVIEHAALRPEGGSGFGLRGLGRGPAPYLYSVTVNRSPSSTRPGSVPLCSSMTSWSGSLREARAVQLRVVRARSREDYQALLARGWTGFRLGTAVHPLFMPPGYTADPGDPTALGLTVLKPWFLFKAQ